MRGILGWGLGIALAGTVGVGCDDHAEVDEKPGADACEHLEGGPIVPVSAAAVGGTAPSLASSHTRYDIAISGAGSVSVPIGEAAEHYFFFDSAAALVIKDGSGAVVAIEEQGTSDENCDLVGAWFVADLEVGTYTLEITPPGSATTVQLVFFEAAGHGH